MADVGLLWAQVANSVVLCIMRFEHGFEMGWNGEWVMRKWWVEGVNEPPIGILEELTAGFSYASMTLVVVGFAQKCGSRQVLFSKLTKQDKQQYTPSLAFTTPSLVSQRQHSHSQAPSHTARTCNENINYPAAALLLSVHIIDLQLDKTAAHV